MLLATRPLEEWEIPREAGANWPEAAKRAHAAWWELRIARQKKIDDSIARNADVEFLYDRPYEDRSRVRVAGPFTVESLSPHRVVPADEEELSDALRAVEGKRRRTKLVTPPTDFAEMVLENLRTAGVQQQAKQDAIKFTSLQAWPGEYIGAVGTFSEQWPVAGGQSEADDQSRTTGHASPATERRAAIFFGPEFGTVSRLDLVAAAREASEARFDVLIACAFNFDAHTTELTRLGPLKILKAKMNPDLHMAEELKNTGKGNLFVVFGEPDITVTGGQWLVTRSGRMVVSYGDLAQLPGLGRLEEINRFGGSDLAGLKQLATGNRPHALRPDALSQIEALTATDFPLALTTDHWTQITVHGVDVFDPNTGEIRSGDTDSIAAWFIDTDYDEENFFVRHAYFLGANDPYKSLKTALRAEIDEEAWATLYRDTSRPFPRPEHGRIAVKVINHFGDEVMKVFGV